MPEAQASISIWNKTFDKELQLSDGAAALPGVLTATAVAGLVGGAAKVVSLGVGEVCGEFVVDLKLIDAGTGDELYIIALQGADDSAFTTNARLLATLLIGDGSKNYTATAADSGLGRYVARFSNVAYRGLTTVPQPAKFVRSIAAALAGTIASGAGLQYAAYLTLDHQRG